MGSVPCSPSVPKSTGQSPHSNKRQQPSTSQDLGFRAIWQCSIDINQLDQSDGLYLWHSDPKIHHIFAWNPLEHMGYRNVQALTCALEILLAGALDSYTAKNQPTPWEIARKKLSNQPVSVEPVPSLVSNTLVSNQPAPLQQLR